MLNAISDSTSFFHNKQINLTVTFKYSTTTPTTNTTKNNAICLPIFCTNNPWKTKNKTFLQPHVSSTIHYNLT